ncbi:MAG: tyrosine-type recombinase/integrase [Aeromonas veronii]
MKPKPTVEVRISDAAIKRHLADPIVRQLKQPGSPLVFRYNKKRTGGTFHLRHYQGNRDRWEMVCRWPEISATQAHTLFNNMKTKLYQDPDALAVVDRLDTIGELLNWYLHRVNNEQGDSPRGRTIKSVIQCHLLPALADVAIADLHKQTGRALIDEKLMSPLQTSVAPSYARLILQVLRQAAARATKLHILTADPLKLWSFTEFSSQRIKPKGAALQRQQVGQLVDAITDTRPETRLLVQLMLMHGTRIGETVAMRWDWIDWAEQVIRLPGHITKTKEPHQIPLTEQAVAILTAYRQQQQGFRRTVYLFPGKHLRKSLHIESAHRYVRAIADGWTSHDLRKLARTIWADMGVDYLVAERLMNHKLSGLDQTYIHSQMERQKRQALVSYHQWLAEQGLFD